MIRNLIRHAANEIEVDYASIGRASIMCLYRLKPADWHVTWLGDNDDDDDTESERSTTKSLVAELAAALTALRPPPDQSSDHNIMNMLNDDCLHTIFECGCLSVWDLVEIADVCQRFARIAHRIFPVRFKCPADQLERHGYGKLWQLDSYLQHFGENVRSMKLYEVPHEDIVAGLLQRSCAHLEELHMNYLEPETMAEAHGMLRKVKKLTLYCNDCDLSDLFASAARLQQIEIFSSLNRVQLTRTNVANLVDFRVNELLFTDQHMVEQFFQANRQLRELRIQQSAIEFGVEHILRHLPNVERLVLNDNDYPDAGTAAVISAFGELRALRTLCLRSEELPFDAILCQLRVTGVPLECLILKDIAVVPHLIDTICGIESIRCLDIGAYPCELLDSHLMQLTQRLRCLTEVKIASNRITLAGIRQMLQMGARIRTAGFVIDKWMDNAVRVPMEECERIAEIRRRNGVELKVVVQAESDQVAVSPVNLWETASFFSLFLQFFMVLSICRYHLVWSRSIMIGCICASGILSSYRHRRGFESV